MENQENEKLVSDMLNSQKPNKSVLSSAKSVMAKNRPIKLRLKKQFYALTSCSAFLMLAGIIFAVLNQISNNGYESNSLEITSESAVATSADNVFFAVAVILISVSISLATSALILKINSNKCE